MRSWIEQVSLTSELRPVGAAVLGSGVIGLSTAILLRQLGVAVTLYAEAVPPNTTSNSACAIWLPIFVGNEAYQTPEHIARFADWALRSWTMFTSLIDRGYGVYWTKNHELFPGPVADPYFSDIVRNFESGDAHFFPGGMSYMWQFDTFVVETPIYLARLHSEFLQLGGVIAQKTFSSAADIEQLPQNLVFNCLGLASRVLFGDTDLRPVKGQLLLHEPRMIDYSIGCGEFAIIPRHDALVLGSLFIEDFTSPDPDDDSSDRIWNTVTSWLRPGSGIFSADRLALDRHRIFKIQSGLRPYRSRGVRLELERIGDKLIIHDYGHGGGGITFSWGCAQMAIELALANGLQ